MKKLTKLFAVLLIFGFILSIMLTGCTNKITTEEPKKPAVESNEDQETPADEQSNQGQSVNKDLKVVKAIFYSMDGDKADMIILDPEVHGNNIVLKDEARVFLTDKEVNTVVSVEIKVLSQSIEIYKVSDTKEAMTEAKYVGFADNNFAEFKMLDQSFMLQIPDENKSKLEKVSTNELLDITIKSNEEPMANPVLVTFKRGQ